MRFSIGPSKKMSGRFFLHYSKPIGQNMAIWWNQKIQSKSFGVFLRTLESRVLTRSEQIKVDWYRWINQGGSWKQQTYQSLGRVTVSHIALSQCVWSYLGRTVKHPAFSIHNFLLVISKKYFLGVFNWNLFRSSYCILNWLLPSQIWPLI